MLTRNPVVPIPTTPIFVPHQTWGDSAANLGGLGTSQAAWPSANRAYYMPLRVSYDLIVVSLSFYCNTRTTGDYELGLYDATGTRIASSGSVAITAGAVNTWTLATPLGFSAGSVFYVAMMVTSTNPTLVTTTQTGGATGDLYRMTGIAQEATGGSLPANATFATPSSNYCPIVALNLAGLPT